jgi:hypothetical protein
MPKATSSGGPLRPIEGCYLIIPIEGGLPHTIVFNILPDISDQKGAAYNDETVIARSSPLKTYSASENRSISLGIHLVVSQPSDIETNLVHLRAIQSAVYPRKGIETPFVPPPICKLKCGDLLAKNLELCVVLKSYSVKFPTEVSWAYKVFTPFKFDIDTSWDVVYKTEDLPGQDRIFGRGA